MRRRYLQTNMSTLSELQLPIETKDLATALDHFLRLWAMADTTPTTKVQLLVITSHPEPIRMIASALPPDQRGFAPLVNRRSVNLTAVEAMGTLDPGTDFTFSGTIVPPLRSAELATLLAKLRELKAGPARRTAITITASGFRWKGSNASATGDLRLMDLKAFHRKTRFTLSAATTAGETSELTPIRAATGLAFSAPRPTATDPQLGEPSCTLEERSLACLRFDHCIETSSQTLRASGFDWTQLAGVHADHEGVSRRFAALTGPAPTPFNWQSRLTKFLKEAFPALRKRNGIFRDAHAYFAKLDEHWDWALIFDTHPGFRIGKVFKIRIGLVATDGPILPFRRSAPLLRCANGSYREGDDTCPEFAFDTELEFEAILASLRLYLITKIPLFVERLRQSFAISTSMPAPELPNNGALTSREALVLAQQILRENKHTPLHLLSARLVDVIDGLHYRTDPAAQLPADGRLNSAYAWVLEYRDGARTREITVPYAGSPRYAERSTATNSIPPISEPHALPDEWIDSTIVAPQFHQAAHALQARYPEMQATVGLLTLMMDSGRAVWRAHIEFSSSRGWVLITHTIDAIDGHTHSTICDERFPDRAQTRNIESISVPPPSRSA